MPDTKTQRHTDIDTDTDTSIQRDTHRHRHTDTDTDTQAHMFHRCEWTNTKRIKFQTHVKVARAAQVAASRSLEGWIVAKATAVIAAQLR